MEMDDLEEMNEKEKDDALESDSDVALESDFFFSFFSPMFGRLLKLPCGRGECCDDVRMYCI